MKNEEEFDFTEFIKTLDQKSVRYLLIGRWAVILHGAPLMTSDYDFWIDPDSKAKLLRLLQSMNFEVPEDRKSPILSVYKSAEKIDLFFLRRIANRENTILDFEKCWKRGEIKVDKQNDLKIRVPSLKDLIELKKIPRQSIAGKTKDATDLQYLEAILKRKQRS